MFQGRRNAKALRIIFISAALLGFSTFARASYEPEAVPGEYLVKLKPGVSAMNVSSLRLNGHVKEVLPHNIVVIERSKIENPTAAISILANNPTVELVEPNYIYHINKMPTSPDFVKLWGMQNTGQLDSQNQKGIAGIDVNAPAAWDITTGDHKLVLAVIDTGVDRTITNLKDNVWINSAEFAGKAGIDDDNNGYVDDIYGWNFASNTPDPMDDHGHGSHVSGTIGARGDTGSGVAGINWNIQIMALKFLDADGSGTLENAIEAIDYGTKMGAKIMSNSWGGGGESDLLKEAIQRANDAGILFVAAAGNESNDNDSIPEYPSGYDVPNIIAVAAIDNRGQLADFSCYGKKSVHIAAPGVNVYSNLPGGKFDSWSGTSMATPHVSGVAALLWSHEPNLTMQQVKARILSRARPLASLRNKVATAGMVDAYHVITDTAPAPDINDPANWPTQNYSASTPHPYTDNYVQTYTITVPGAKRIAARFSKFQTESNYDFAEFFDANGKKFGQMSGTNDDSFSAPVDGDTIVIKFHSDDSNGGYGFDVNGVAVQR